MSEHKERGDEGEEEEEEGTVRTRPRPGSLALGIQLMWDMHWINQRLGKPCFPPFLMCCQLMRERQEKVDRSLREQLSRLPPPPSFSPASLEELMDLQERLINKYNVKKEKDDENK